jgi:hypothetical protein
MVNKLTANNNDIGKTNHELVITNYIPCYKCILIRNYLSGVFAKESQKINLLHMQCPPACRSICERSSSTTKIDTKFDIKIC